MKRILFSVILATCTCAMTHAQQVNFGPLHSADSPREDWILPGDTILQAGKKMIYNGKPIKNPDTSTAINNKEKASLQKGDLHQGLNVSVDLSAFATFGSNLPHKGGFGQTINATYLAPLTKDEKLWIAGGGYFNNTFWGNDSYRDAGLYAILGYRFNEHWEAYVYGQLSLANNYNSLYNRYYGGYGWGGYPGYYRNGLGMWHTPMGCAMPFGYGMGTPGANVLGAGVRYNVNKNFSIGINVEGVWYNNHNSSTYYFDRYNYPVAPIK